MVLSGRVEKALVWLKARVESVERKALVKVALCVEYPESHGRSTCTRGARVRGTCLRGARDASGQAEGRRENGSRDSLFFLISFYLGLCVTAVGGACGGI